MFLFRFATSSQPNEAFDCVKWTFVKVAFLRRAHHWVWLMFCFCKRNTGVEFLKVFSVRCQRGRGQGDRGLAGGGGWMGYYPTGVGWIMACPHCLSGVPRLKKRSIAKSKAIIFFPISENVDVEILQRGNFEKKLFLCFAMGLFSPSHAFSGGF